MQLESNLLKFMLECNNNQQQYVKHNYHAIGEALLQQLTILTYYLMSSE